MLKFIRQKFLLFITMIGPRLKLKEPQIKFKNRYNIGYLNISYIIKDVLTAGIIHYFFYVVINTFVQ